MSSTNADFPPQALRAPLAELVKLLESSSNVKIAVAETTTGGLLSAALLSVPGASAWYVGGATLYTLQSRTAWAGWTQGNIDAYKGPSEDVVAGLAKHVCSALGATHCIGETGVAGPTTKGKTILGTTWIAVADASGAVATRAVDTGLGGDRVGNMLAFASAALQLLIDVLKGETPLSSNGGQAADGGPAGPRM